MQEEQQNPDGVEPGALSRREINEAIAGLDRATRDFSRQVDAIRDLTPERRTTFEPRTPVHEPPPPAPHRNETSGHDPRPLAPPPEPRREAERAPEMPSRPEQVARIEPETAFEEQMRVADQEARAYLERAKRRADSLVNSMIGAVEHEAHEIKRDAEDGIRRRWEAVEAEAGNYLEDAKRVADGMVSERQHQIGALSDGIVDRAQSLTAGMEDAERVRDQFEGFIRALSATANQIAKQPRGAVDAEITRLQERRASGRRNVAAA